MFRDRNPSFKYLAGINQYVPAMQYASALVHGQPCDFLLGTPAAVDADALVDGVDAQVLATTQVDKYADSRYGRIVTGITSAAQGATSPKVVVRGFDYLGQPMMEELTVTSGGVAGVKAFYHVVSAELTIAATNAVTFDIGWGTKVGLPFKSEILAAREGGTMLLTAAVQAKRTAPVVTDPATATTGDPRGLYEPTTLGVEVIVTLMGIPDVNADGNGGLMGIKQYYA